MELISWKALLEKEHKPVPFLIDPYIPRESIIFLYGDTSLGKSPLTWAMASAIGSGTSFYGLPTTPGTVLYVEADTPEVVVSPRLQLVRQAPEGVWFLFSGKMSAPMLGQAILEELIQVQEELHPDLVVLNTLRCIHDEDDKDSAAPKKVYSFFQKVFPGAALLFVHHIRKAPTDPRIQENERESFSGSKHWLDDAQVGLHLSRYNTKESRENLRLIHSKSQVSEVINPMGLKLHPDGTTITSPAYGELLRVYELLNSEPDRAKHSIDVQVAQEMGVSESTAKRRRLMIEAGRFPGSRQFMSNRNEGGILVEAG